MVTHLDIENPEYARAAERILRLHDNFEAEANITSAVRDFLILTGLARADEMVEENPPSDGSRRAVDLTALDTFIEVKRRIGTAAGFEPNPEYVQQLDDYLAESERSGGRVRMGILTDGQAVAAALAGRGRASDGLSILIHAGVGGQVAASGGMDERQGAGVQRGGAG